MNEQKINNLVASLKSTYQGGAVIYLAAAGGIFLGVTVHEGFYILGGLFLFLSIFVVFSIKKLRAEMKFIQENYEYNQEAVMVIVDREIKKWEGVIANELRKADRGGRDAIDSADDAVRKTKTLNKWKALKAAIDEFHGSKFSNDF